jgi:hypoxanthine-guanine phosphoribosyltransferase
MDEVAEALAGKDVLILDDVNTSQSTLMEILKVINKVAIPKKITIFTILGKSYTRLIGK